MVIHQLQNSQREAPVYNIKAVSRLTGVPADTLRRWESRYSIIKPQRTEGGYRLYSQRDVDTINWLKDKLEEGLSISRACEMLRHLGGDPGSHAATPPSPRGARPPDIYSDGATGVRSFEALRDELLEAFRGVDEERASVALTDALSLYSLEQVCLEILQPALVEVGEAWLRGEVPVATEHFAAAFVRTRLSNLFHSSPYNTHGPLVLVACAPEELHEIGPMVLAVFLRRAGFKVVYLGQNVPLDSLQGMVETMQPDAICISASRPETAAHLHSLREFLDNLKKERGRAPLLAYGGRVFNRFRQITERLGGAYLGEDAGVAVRVLSDRLNGTRRLS